MVVGMLIWLNMVGFCQKKTHQNRQARHEDERTKHAEMEVSHQDSFHLWQSFDPSPYKWTRHMDTICI